MKIANKIMLMGAMLISLLAYNMNTYARNPINSNGDYGLSCTNTGYGASLGGNYIQQTMVVLVVESITTEYILDWIVLMQVPVELTVQPS